MTQRGLSTLGGQELLNLGKLQGQALLGDGAGNAVLIVDGERLAPIALTTEDSVAQTVVDLYATQIVLGYIFLCGSNSLNNRQSIEREPARCKCSSGRVDDGTLFCVEALFADVAALDERTYLYAEMFCKGIVA